MSEHLRSSFRLSSMGGLQKLTLLSLATMVNTHIEEKENTIDLTTLVMNGDRSPRLYKIIEEDNDGNSSVEHGWRVMMEDNRLLNDVRFRDQFLYKAEIVQQFNDGDISIIEGRCSLFRIE